MMKKYYSRTHLQEKFNLCKYQDRERRDMRQIKLTQTQDQSMKKKLLTSSDKRLTKKY